MKEKGQILLCEYRFGFVLNKTHSIMSLTNCCSRVSECLVTYRAEHNHIAVYSHLHVIVKLLDYRLVIIFYWRDLWSPTEFEI